MGSSAAMNTSDFATAFTAQGFLDKGFLEGPLSIKPVMLLLQGSDFSPTSRGSGLLPLQAFDVVLFAILLPKARDEHFEPAQSVLRQRRGFLLRIRFCKR